MPIKYKLPTGEEVTAENKAEAAIKLDALLNVKPVTLTPAQQSIADKLIEVKE